MAAGKKQDVGGGCNGHAVQSAEQAAFDSIPKDVSSDLKWFVFNQAWFVVNTKTGSVSDANKDKKKRNEHLKAVESRQMFSSDFLARLRKHTQDSAEVSAMACMENSSLVLPDVDSYVGMKAPAGVTDELWVRLVQVVDMMAATVGLQKLGDPNGDEWESMFNEAWENLSVSAVPRRQEHETPLASLPGLRAGSGGGDSDVEDAGFAPALIADGPTATALTDNEGLPARVGCMGLWLDCADLIVACKEGMMTEFAGAFDIGTHSPRIRKWPEIYHKSPVLLKLLGKDGACCAKEVKRLRMPSENILLQMSGTSLQPLQSFANARAVKEKLGLAIVKGWALYDITTLDIGEGYLAEQYWWNTTESGRKGWVDFTPRPNGHRELVLVEAEVVPPPRRRWELDPEDLALAEGLFCLRSPELVVRRRAELGTCGAVAVALQSSMRQAEARGVGVERRVMANACIPGACLDELDPDDENYPVMQELVSLLEVFSRPCQKHDVQDQDLQSLVEAGGVEALVSLTASEETWIAATAASALACACHGNPDVQLCAWNAGAPLALANLFDREDIRFPCCYAAEAVDALWKEESRAVMESRYAGGRQKNDGRVQEFWGELLNICQAEMREEHRQRTPRERCGHSWGRVLAFAQVALGDNGTSVRRPTNGQPFVIWVLGAEDAVEGSLAEEGFFDDANFVERGPTEVILFGEGLRRLRPRHAPLSGNPAVVRTANYREMPWLGHFGVPPPDFAAVLMPEVCTPDSPCRPRGNLPDLALAAVAQVPIIISQRFGPRNGRDDTNYSHKLGKSLIMPHVRCPFSTSSGSPDVSVDDNGWIFAVQGQGALTKALMSQVAPEVVMPFVSQGLVHRKKQTVVFWGILDIKYDTARPVLDRVKVLETGDGVTSKFSHDGASIKNRYEARYVLGRDAVDLDMQHVISADKKLTHDIVEQAQYGHLVPRQACFPRQYQPDLAKRVQEALDLTEDDKVVLKLCNRTRAAGVVISPVSELDDVLEDLLQPPADLEGWFEERFCTIMDVEGSAVELGLGTQSSFEEQKRHWWSNESPVFVAEAWCKSVPVVREGQLYDGTMRVGFALKCQREEEPASPANGGFAHEGLPLGMEPLQVTPENLEVDWLGGYWKLPKSDMDSGSASLRECVVSAAKTSGTAMVNATDLLEVFAALGDVVQQLYGRAKISSTEIAELYRDRPELAAFITARLGTTTVSKRPGFARNMLEAAEGILNQLPSGPGQSGVQAFIRRAWGYLAMQMPPGAESDPAAEHFEAALRLQPTNANAMHLFGLRLLQSRGQSRGAVEPLTRSLLLDPDYKGVYVNLGMAYLRLGNWKRCIDVSEAGQARHPNTPQFDYHMAVAYSQMALELVNAAAERTKDMAKARASVDRSKLRKAELEARELKAAEDVALREAELQESKRVRDAAGQAVEVAVAADRTRPIEAGTRFRARRDMSIFASFMDYNEIGTLRKDQVVVATGPVQTVDNYTMLPIQPRGAVDMDTLELIPPPETATLMEERDRAANLCRICATAKADAKKAHLEAKKSLADPLPQEAKISRRDVKKLLTDAELRKYRVLKEAARDAWTSARDHEMARTRRRSSGSLAPWLEVDDEMLLAMEREEGPVHIKLPTMIGWASAQYRL